MLACRSLSRRLIARRASRPAPRAPVMRRFISGVNVSNAAPGNPYQAKTSSKLPSAMEMVNMIPPVVVDGRTAACDGGGPLGHPRVFISTDPATLADPAPCPYCGLRYVSKTAVIDHVKAGKSAKEGSDFIQQKDVESYLNGARKVAGQ